MNELSRHIEILLLDSDCVIVPGFGGFMAHHRPAEYVNETGMFYPPQRTLGFNPHLKLNDSLLAQSYVEAYDISYPEAVKRIEEDIEEIKQNICINGEYEFHGIGTIKMSSEEVYNFEPCTSGLLTPHLYALNSYSFDMLEAEASVATPVTINIETTSEPSEESETTDELEEETFSEEFEETDGIHISRQVIHYIATAAIILCLFIFSSIPAGQGSSNISVCSVIDTEIITSFVKDNMKAIPAFTAEVKKDCIPQIITLEDIDMEEVPEEPIVKDTPEAPAKEESKVVSEKKGSYAIVLASRVSKQGANDFVERLTKQGLKNVSVNENTSARKVVYGNYPTKEEANKDLNKMRETNENFAEAWIAEI